MNNRQHPLKIFKHVIVPKSQHSEAIKVEKPVPFFIFLPGGSVLSAIEFDYQSLFKADEIDDVAVDGLLSPEFISYHLFSSQLLPQKNFSFGCTLT